MIDLKSQMLSELQQEMEQLGEPKFRAKQISSWMHEKLADSFDEMTNLPKSLREKLQQRYEWVRLELVQVQQSDQDGTCKFLFRLPDGNVIESVRMKYHHGNSVCISSQAGCRMGCRFCASTLNGLERNLKASEMLEQIYAITRLSGERVSNVVVMGMGEPLDNYDNLIRFLALLTGEKGLHMSQRNVTVSTCGIVPGIRRLADEGLQITLALSLHAVTDEKRKKLMPIAEKYPLEEVLSACAYYGERTGRRITCEYSLIAGVNDGDADVAGLAQIAGRLRCHINLIPVNPVTERGFAAPDRRHVQDFKSRLEKGRVNVTVRREMGRDIDGACGQLRRRYESG